MKKNFAVRIRGMAIYSRVIYKILEKCRAYGEANGEEDEDGGDGAGNDDDY